MPGKPLPKGAARLGEGAFKIKRSAEISECGTYRWWLHRVWRPGPIVCFVMLNPSTADANIDDPTVRKCMGFAWRWGFAGLSVRNIYPYRATDPKDLFKAMKRLDVTGGERGATELKASMTADLLVAAWGTKVSRETEQRFFDLTSPKPVYCVNATAESRPLHPLYQRYTSKPMAMGRCQNHFWSDVLGDINKCQLCLKESPAHLWVKDACPCCGEKYDYILAQDSEED